MRRKQPSLKLSSSRQPNLNDLVKENQRKADVKASEVIIPDSSPSKDLEKECRQKAIEDFLKTPEELRQDEERRQLALKQKEVRDHFFLAEEHPKHRLGFRSVE